MPANRLAIPMEDFLHTNPGTIGVAPVSTAHHVVGSSAGHFSVLRSGYSPRSDQGAKPRPGPALPVLNANEGSSNQGRRTTPVRLAVGIQSSMAAAIEDLAAPAVRGSDAVHRNLNLISASLHDLGIPIPCTFSVDSFEAVARLAISKPGHATLFGTSKEGRSELMCMIPDKVGRLQIAMAHRESAWSFTPGLPTGRAAGTPVVQIPSTQFLAQGSERLLLAMEVVPVRTVSGAAWQERMRHHLSSKALGHAPDRPGKRSKVGQQSHPSKPEAESPYSIRPVTVRDDETTVVCDGNGGLEIHIALQEAENCPDLAKQCLTVHEQTHLADFERDAPGICKGVAKDYLPVAAPPAIYLSEIKAYSAQIDCLENNSKQAADPWLKKFLHDELEGRKQQKKDYEARLRRFNQR